MICPLTGTQNTTIGVEWLDSVASGGAALRLEEPVLSPACLCPSVSTVPKATLAHAEMQQFVP